MNGSPNVLSRDGCYTLGVLKPCYSIETSKNCSKQPKTDLEQCQMHGDLTKHLTKQGTDEGKLSYSTQQSLYKEQLQGIPLKKQDILRVYSDVFTRIGKFPGPPYKFQLKPDAKPARHALMHVPIHLQEAIHKEIRNLECLGILEPVKEVTEWVNSLCDSGEEGSRLISTLRTIHHRKSWESAWIQGTRMRHWSENPTTLGASKKSLESSMEWHVSW